MRGVIRQRGDAMVVVVVLLAVALLCAVGWIAYGKIIGTEDVADTEQAAEQSAVNLSEFCAPHEKMCFNYPEAWTLSAGESDYPLTDDEFIKIDKITVVSPSGDVQISLLSGISGIGGVCFPEEMAGKAYRQNSQATQLMGYAGDDRDRFLDTVHAVALVVSSGETSEASFMPIVGLTTSKRLVHEDDLSECDAVYFGLVEGRNIDFGDIPGHGATQLVSGGGLGDGARNKSYATLTEAEAALDSEEYKQAFDIVASAHYK